jgi:hypothetical protein
LLQNDASPTREVLARAQMEVTRLFRLIDVEINWVSDVPDDGTRLRVVSLTTWEPPDNRIPPTVLGFTQGGQTRGSRGYVFWHRVERASQKFSASLYAVLAIAIAHELGHMLLPDASHANRGLMVSPWDSGHFRAASAGDLHFSPDSAERIRHGLIEESRSLPSNAR